MERESFRKITVEIAGLEAIIIRVSLSGVRFITSSTLNSFSVRWHISVPFTLPSINTFH